MKAIGNKSFFTSYKLLNIYFRMLRGNEEICLALVLLLVSGSYGIIISCYECDWDQVSGCKTAAKAKANKDNLKTNCTVCYKNVVPYEEGLAAASGEQFYIAVV